MKQARLQNALQCYRTDIVYDILSDLLYAAFRKGIRIEQEQNPLCVLIGYDNRFVHLDSVFRILEWPEDRAISANLLDLIEGWGGSGEGSFQKAGKALWNLSQTWNK